MNKSNFLRNILPIAAGTAIFFTFNYLQKPLNAQITNVHLTMGNPTNANTSFSNFLLSKVQYATSHNCFEEHQIG